MPFQEVLQSIRYLLNRPLCFRLEREFAGVGLWRCRGFAFTDGSSVPYQGTHNNAAENAIRPLAVGRKNWLFIGSQQAGERAAVIMTLIESAKLNGHDPWAYLKDVFERLPTLKNADLHLLLPHLWTAPPATTVPNIASTASK